MTKGEFTAELWQRLSALSANERAQTIDYYMEIVEERMEEGMTEEEAVAALEPVDVIADRLLADMPHRPGRRRGALIGTLITMGSPIWLSVLLALFAVLLSTYAAAWVMVLSLWAAAVSLAAGGALTAAAGPFQAVTQGAIGWYTTGMGLIFTGSGVLLIVASAKLTAMMGHASAKSFGWMFQKLRRRSRA